MDMDLIATYASLQLEAMQNLAARLAALLAPEDVVTLSGDLGSGKTTFARALIQSLCGAATEVASPTFTLMQSYNFTCEGRDETLRHLDLYRLKSMEEAWELGLEELWPHVTLIEWAEIIEPLIPSENRLDIAFDFGDSSDSRTVMLSGGDAWKARVLNFKL